MTKGLISDSSSARAPAVANKAPVVAKVRASHRASLNFRQTLNNQVATGRIPHRSASWPPKLGPAVENLDPNAPSPFSKPVEGSMLKPPSPQELSHRSSSGTFSWDERRTSVLGGPFAISPKRRVNEVMKPPTPAPLAKVNSSRRTDRGFDVRGSDVAPQPTNSSSSYSSSYSSSSSSSSGSSSSSSSSNPIPYRTSPITTTTTTKVLSGMCFSLVDGRVTSIVRYLYLFIYTVLYTLLTLYTLYTLYRTIPHYTHYTHYIHCTH